MLPSMIHPGALALLAFHAFDAAALDFNPPGAGLAPCSLEAAVAPAIAAVNAPFDISGTWENPAGEDVTFNHDRRTGALRIRWSFNSSATGTVTLRGSGVAVGDGADGLELSAEVPPFPLLIGGKRCEGSRIGFSAEAKVWRRGVLMDNCSLSFSWQCPGEEPTSGTNYCSGLWL